MTIGNSFCAKSVGGVESIELLPAEALLDATYDPVAKALRGLTLRDECEPLGVAFREGEASLEESIDDHGNVAHRLRFLLDGVAPEGLHRLLSALRGGVVALVATEGEHLLVGYSPELRAEAPLRLHSLQRHSLQRYDQTPHIAVELRSSDSRLSLPLYGRQ
jgi:hypothetical protein